MKMDEAGDQASFSFFSLMFFFAGVFATGLSFHSFPLSAVIHGHMSPLVILSDWPDWPAPISGQLGTYGFLSRHFTSE